MGLTSGVTITCRMKDGLGWRSQPVILIIAALNHHSPGKPDVHDFGGKPLRIPILPRPHAHILVLHIFGVSQDSQKLVDRLLSLS